MTMPCRHEKSLIGFFFSPIANASNIIYHVESSFGKAGIDGPHSTNFGQISTPQIYFPIINQIPQQRAIIPHARLTGSVLVSGIEIALQFFLPYLIVRIRQKVS